MEAHTNDVAVYLDLKWYIDVFPSPDPLYYEILTDPHIYPCFDDPHFMSDPFN